MSALRSLKRGIAVAQGQARESASAAGRKKAAWKKKQREKK
jgi:hypothetical protein